MILQWISGQVCALGCVKAVSAGVGVEILWADGCSDPRDSE